jgi:hypothetical protein
MLAYQAHVAQYMQTKILSQCNKNAPSPLKMIHHARLSLLTNAKFKKKVKNQIKM